MKVKQRLKGYKITIFGDKAKFEPEMETFLQESAAKHIFKQSVFWWCLICMVLNIYEAVTDKHRLVSLCSAFLAGAFAAILIIFIGVEILESE